MTKETRKLRGSEIEIENKGSHIEINGAEFNPAEIGSLRCGHDSFTLDMVIKTVQTYIVGIAPVIVCKECGEDTMHFAYRSRRKEE